MPASGLSGSSRTWCQPDSTSSSAAGPNCRLTTWLYWKPVKLSLPGHFPSQVDKSAGLKFIACTSRRSRLRQSLCVNGSRTNCSVKSVSCANRMPVRTTPAHVGWRFSTVRVDDEASTEFEWKDDERLAFATRPDVETILHSPNRDLHRRSQGL
jgi:hypothetical protein